VRYPAVAVVGNSVYLFGGPEFGGECTGTFSRAVQKVNLAGRRATIVGRLPTTYAHAMATLRAGEVFVLDGSTPARASSAILRFDPATGAVSRAGTYPSMSRTAASQRSVTPPTYSTGSAGGRVKHRLRRANQLKPSRRLDKQPAADRCRLLRSPDTGRLNP
jgi:hypothetical protein